MAIQVTATVVDGALKVDHPVNLPDNSIVRLTVEPVSIPSVSPEEREAAWDRFLKLIEERPINSGGHRFTRDELHERR